MLSSPAPPKARMLDASNISADNVWEFARRHVIMPAAFPIVMRVEGIQRIGGRVAGQSALALIWPVNRKTVERESYERRVLLALIDERRVYADRILVIVIAVVRSGMAAAAIHDARSICHVGVERIEEDHAVYREPDR